jgi:hypothetical protein
VVWRLDEKKVRIYFDLGKFWDVSRRDKVFHFGMFEAEIDTELSAAIDNFGMRMISL